IGAKGYTNGDLALRKIAQMVDTLHISGRCHVIMATDGIFHLSEKTKAFADTVFAQRKTSFCVLQFGDEQNEDLKEVATISPDGMYALATRKNIPAILRRQVPVPQKTAVPQTVYYTDIVKMRGAEFVQYYLQLNPDDGLASIPRR
ncbi:MAG TPA: hypothetical protein VFU15_16495, partial [Bacteroidia bacterium]|nr:hypothetical protein [Bacteroidia bacterium]